MLTEKVRDGRKSFVLYCHSALHWDSLRHCFAERSFPSTHRDTERSFYDLYTLETVLEKLHFRARKTFFFFFLVWTEGGNYKCKQLSLDVLDVVSAWVMDLLH